jgi:hypothetical protein
MVFRLRRLNGSPCYEIESTDDNWRSALVEVGVG